MVKVTVGEMSCEGTAEEIKELFEVLGAEFPSTPEATEDYDEEVSEDLPVGTKIRVKSDGRLMTLSERKPEHDVMGLGKAYGLKGKSTWLGEVQFEVVEDSDEVTKPSFQEGDIAVVTGETYCGDICKGVKVRVTDAELDEDGELRISLLDGSDYDWAKPEALELVVDELAEAKAKFPEGAKVRIAIPEDEETRFKRGGVKNSEVGTVVAVIEDYPGDIIVSVDFDSRRFHWNGIPSELEVVTEEGSEEIEVGDIIATKFYGILEVYGINEYDYHEVKVRINGRDDALGRNACTLVAKKSDRKDL